MKDPTPYPQSCLPLCLQQTLLQLLQHRSAQDTSIDEGVVAHLPPNLIASGIPERLTNGTTFITSLYQGTTVESFDLS